MQLLFPAPAACPCLPWRGRCSTHARGQLWVGEQPPRGDEEQDERDARQRLRRPAERSR